MDSHQLLDSLRDAPWPELSLYYYSLAATVTMLTLESYFGGHFIRNTEPGNLLWWWKVGTYGFPYLCLAGLLTPGGLGFLLVNLGCYKLCVPEVTSYLKGFGHTTARARRIAFAEGIGTALPSLLFVSLYP